MNLFVEVQVLSSTSSGSLLIRTPRQGSWKLGLIPRQRCHHLRWKDKPECRGGFGELAQLVVRLICIQEVSGSNPLFSMSFFILIMSLISQTDRQMVIEALDYYLLSLKTYHTPNEEKIYRYNTLLNWIKLEHSKNNGV